MPVNYGEAEPIHQTNAEILPMLDVRQRPLFEVFVYPNRHRWEPALKRYLPELVRSPRSPGVMGVSEDGDASAMIAWHQRMGGVLVRQGDPRLKMPGDPNKFLTEGQFRVRFVGYSAERGKGTYLYGYAWEHYERVSQGRDGRVEWGEDAEARQRFQLHLLKIGVATEPSSLFRRSQLGKLHTRIREAESRQNRTRTGDIRIKQLRALHVDLVADLRAHGEDVPAQYRLEDTPEWKDAPKRSKRKVITAEIEPTPTGETIDIAEDEA